MNKFSEGVPRASQRRYRYPNLTIASSKSSRSYTLYTLLLASLITILMATAHQPVYATILPTITKTLVGNQSTFAAGEEFQFRITVECNVTQQGESCSNFVLQDVMPSFTDINGNSVQLDYVTATSSPQLGSPVENPNGTVTYTGGLPGGSATFIEITAKFPSGITPDGTAVTNEAFFGPDDGSGNPDPNDPLTVSDTAPVSATAQPSELATTKSVLTDPIRVNEEIEYQAQICSLGDPQGGALTTVLDNAMLIDTLASGAVVANSDGGTVNNNVITWSLGTITLAPGQCITRTYSVIYPSNHPNPPTADAPFALDDQVPNALIGSGNNPNDPGNPFEDDADVTITLLPPEPPSAEATINKSASRGFVDTDLTDNDAGTGDEGDSLFFFRIRANSTGNQPLDNVVISDNMPAEFNLTEIRLGTWTGGGSVTVTVADDGGVQAVYGPFNSGAAPIDVSAIDYVANVTLDYGSVPADWQLSEVRLYGYPVNPDHDGTTHTLPHRFTNTANLTADAPLGLDDVNVSNSASTTIDDDRPEPRITKRIIGPGSINPTLNGNVITVTWEVELFNPNAATGEFPQPILADIVPAPLQYVAGSATVQSAPAGAGTPTIVEPADGSNGTIVRWEFPGTLERGERIFVRFDTTVADAQPPTVVTNDGYATTNATTNIRWNPEADTGDLDGDGDETDGRITDSASVEIETVAGIDSEKLVRGPDGAGYQQNTTTRPGAEVDWRLSITNTGNVGLDDVSVIEILPHVGDTFVNQTFPRGSQWNPNLVGPVVGPDFQVEYSTSGNPCRPNVTTGCDAPNWSTALPADVTTVRSIRATFIGDLGEGPGVLPAGASVSFEWLMRAPTNAQEGEVARNSFAWFGTAVTTGEEITAEPAPVTVTIDGSPLPNFVGNFVFCDFNFNGIQDGGREIGRSGVRAELWLDTNNNGTFEPGLDLFQDFTVTDPATGVLGQYLFEDRPDGQYFIVMVPPAGAQVTPTGLGNDNADSDLFWDDTNGVWRTEAIDLDLASVLDAVGDLDWDAGLFCVEPNLDLEKSTNGLDSDTPTGAYIPVGDAVTWTYEVVNSGNMILNNVAVTDNQGVPVTCPETTLYPTFLDPNRADFIANHPLYSATGPSSMTCVVNTAFTAQLGQYANIGTVTGQPEQPPVAHLDAPLVDESYPNNIVDTDPSHYYGADPAIDIEKSTNGVDADAAADGPFVLVGATVQWRYRIENTGNTTLLNVTVTDSIEDFASDATCDRAYPARLEPGDVMICTIDSESVAGQYRNDADVVGTPVDGSDQPYGDPNVTDEDPSHYYGADPAIDIEKTTNGVQSDNAPGQYVQTGTTVTWVYTVTNTGNMTLANVTVVDTPEGNVTASCRDGNGNLKAQPMVLAPDEVVTCTASDTAGTGQYANTATATGDPAVDSGTPIDNLDEVDDDDPSHYFGVAPGIAIEKTVYRGSDSGASCPGGESVGDVSGTVVTYCFEVTNTGDTYLDDVTVTDNDLGIDESDMVLLSGNTPLAPNATLVYYYVASIDGDLLNTAATTGNPTDSNGNDLPGAEDPTDDDTASVDQIGPGIRLEKTVYLGQDGGTSCHVEGQSSELVWNTAGALVTYCFVVTNTGDVPLTNITIADPLLNNLFLNVVDFPATLAVGASITVHANGTLSTDLVNTAETTGTPVDANGDPVSNTTVSDDDDAEVKIAVADIELEKTDYLGHDNGASCEGGELSTGTAGTAVTYCFKVTNTGDTYLNGQTLTDNDLGITLMSTTLLAPGESVILHADGVITGDLLNMADVSGIPADENGTTLPGVEHPTDDDTARVELVAPAIELQKTVYAGHNGGASCQGGELVTAVSGAPITYCFVVTNRGDTYLNNITIADADLGINRSNMTLQSGTEPLAPGQSMLFSYDATLTNDLLNRAETEGNPSDPQGNDLPGVDNPSDDDTARVDLVGPGIQLEKTVYLGHDAGSSCEGGNLAVGSNGADVTYCFLVTNTGDTYLTDVLLDDAQLGIDQGDMTVVSGTSPLAPGAEMLFYYETAMTSDLVNVASVTGTPSAENGDPLPNTPKPSDQDDAEVTVAEPNIVLDKTVYAGHNNGASCQGGELVTDVRGTPVTYCFAVTNSGGTYLTDIAINDSDLGINQSDMTLHNGSLPLAPNAMLVYYVQSTIAGDLLNRADVIGTPSDAGGTPLPDLPKPTDEDTAEVDETPSMTLTKTAAPLSLPEPGGIFEFTVRITNTSSELLTLTSLVDDPYGDLTDTNNANLLQSNCTLATMAPGATYECAFSVEISGSAGQSFRDIVTAVATSSDGDTVDANDDATVTITPSVGQPLIDATKRDSLQNDADGDGGFSPGDAVRYTIVISNRGDAAGAFSLLNDITDPNVTLVNGSVQSSQGVVTEGNTAGDQNVVVNVGSVAPGAMIIIRFDVTINDPLPEGVTQVLNQAVISGQNFPSVPTDDPDTPEDDDSTVTRIDRNPVLDSLKAVSLAVDADGDGKASAGDTLHYLITIANSGNAPATSVVLNDTPDANTFLLNGTVQASQGTIVSGNGAGEAVIIVNVGTIAADSAVTIEYDVRIKDPLLASVRQVANQGIVTSKELPPVDTDDPATTSPDDPTVTPLFATPKLTAQKVDFLFIDSDGDEQPSPGDTILYRVDVVNSGNSPATGVIFTDTVDANSTLVPNSVQSSQGTITQGNAAGDTAVRIEIGTISGNGGAVTITYRVAINDPLPNDVTFIENQGVIQSNELTDVVSDDPDAIGSDDPTRTPVVATPLLQFSKKDSLLIDADDIVGVSSGDTLLYQLTVVNYGNTAANKVVLNDTPDPNTTVVPGSVQTSQGLVTSGNSSGDSVIIVDLGSIPAGGSATVAFQVTINENISVKQIANQAVVTYDNSGATGTRPANPVASDDPDTGATTDPTLTTIVSKPTALDTADEPDFVDTSLHTNFIYLPITLK